MQEATQPMIAIKDNSCGSFYAQLTVRIHLTSTITY